MTKDTDLKERISAVQAELVECQRLLDSKERQLPDILWVPGEGAAYFGVLGYRVSRYWNVPATEYSPFVQLHKTKEAAQLELDNRGIKLKILRRIAELNHAADWVPKFKDGKHQNYYMYYTNNTGDIECNWVVNEQAQPTNQYFYAGVYAKLVAEFTDKELKIFLGV